MIKTLKRNFLWVFFGLFVAAALLTRGDEPLFFSTGPYAVGKPIIWLVFLCFLAYSVYCSTQANFIKSLPKLNQYIWARQIGLDLYISVFLSLALIYFNEGSVWIMLLWAAPVLVFANLAILLYIALHYDSLIARIVS